MMKKLFGSKKFVALFIVILAIIVIPTTIFLVNQQQDLRQRAASPSCTTLQQQLTYLQSNNLCQNDACTTLQTYLQQLDCSVLNPSTTPGTQPTISVIPTNFICNPTNPACPSGYSCTNINSSTGICTPAVTIQPTTSPTACKVKPTYCSSFWSFLPQCQTPSQGWCPSTTPSPTVSVSPTQSQNLSPTQATTSPTQTPTTTPGVLLPEKVIFDFNDDGKVEELDLNILYTGFSKRNGD